MKLAKEISSKILSKILKLLGNTDISGVGDGTVTGAISNIDGRMTTASTNIQTINGDIDDINENFTIKRYSVPNDFSIDSDIEYPGIRGLKCGKIAHIEIRGAMPEHEENTTYEIANIISLQLMPSTDATQEYICPMNSGTGSIGYAKVIMHYGGAISVVPYQSDCNWILIDITYITRF